MKLFYNLLNSFKTYASSDFMDLTKIWKITLGEIELLVTKPVFRTFFSRSLLISLDREVATIGCSTGVAVTVLEGRYYSLIKNLLDKHTQQNISLVFKISAVKTSPADAGPLFSNPDSGTWPTTRVSWSTQTKPKLRPDYTFGLFAVSSTNQMAYAAATAVADTPGTSYNPLFFYGGVGVGKTHLMQAIGHEVLGKKPEIKVVYCTGEEFTNEIIDAIQTKTTKRFKDKYRSAKVLLIDDVQFLQGKIKVQEEFFHTFNAVQKEGGQVVLTSDRPPHEIDKLEERLKSRFEGGLLVDMQKPDFELRCAILRIKAQQQGIDLSIPFAQILAANCESVRKLEGLLTKLVTEARFKKIAISEELVKNIVGKPLLENSSSKNHLTPKQIIDMVILRYNLTLTQIKGPRRSRPLARPRQVLMYLLRTELGLPLEDVGTWVGGRDHSTVLHAVDTVTSLMLTNELIRGDVEWIKKSLSG